MSVLVLVLLLTLENSVNSNFDQFKFIWVPSWSLTIKSYLCKQDSEQSLEDQAKLSFYKKEQICVSTRTSSCPLTINYSLNCLKVLLSMMGSTWNIFNSISTSWGKFQNTDFSPVLIPHLGLLGERLVTLQTPFRHLSDTY